MLKENRFPYFLVCVVSFSILFVPFLVAFISVFALLLLSSKEQGRRPEIFISYLLLVVIVFGLAINSSSRELFKYYEDDFVVYFNNYLCFSLGSEQCFL